MPITRVVALECETCSQVSLVATKHSVNGFQPQRTDSRDIPNGRQGWVVGRLKVFCPECLNKQGQIPCTGCDGCGLVGIWGNEKPCLDCKGLGMVAAPVGAEVATLAAAAVQPAVGTESVRPTTTWSKGARGRRGAEATVLTPDDTADSAVSTDKPAEG